MRFKMEFLDRYESVISSSYLALIQNGRLSFHITFTAFVTLIITKQV